MVSLPFYFQIIEFLGSCIQKDWQVTFFWGDSKYLKIYMKNDWKPERSTNFWSPYYSNPSGKLGGFAQENNTIDSGELDIGRRAIQEVPPGIFWRSQLFIDQPQFLKFNISLQKDALIGVYGRKGLPPSHTQVRTACIKSRTHYWEPWSCIFRIFFSLRITFFSILLIFIFSIYTLLVSCDDQNICTTLCWDLEWG